MKHLIDRDAVVAEIERLVNNQDYALDYEAALEDVRNFIDTLEVKEDFKDVKSVFEGQYLTKDKVVTTIERLQDECEEQGDNNGVELLEKLFNKLDTIEVKDVDLEKHLKEDIEDVFFDLDGVAVKGATHYITVEDVKYIAKNFFELGMSVSNKAQKEK